MKPSYLAAGCLFVAAMAPGQTICIGTTEQCRQAQIRLCADEDAPPNLTVRRDAEIKGIVLDQTGAPFGSGIAVQLRKPSMETVIRWAVPSSNGRFTLGPVAAGAYRVIVVGLRKGRAERLAGFTQPTKLQCIGRKSCNIKVVPLVHGSDNPIDSCGPR